MFHAHSRCPLANASLIKVAKTSLPSSQFIRDIAFQQNLEIFHTDVGGCWGLPQSVLVFAFFRKLELGLPQEMRPPPNRKLVVVYL
jgi:hypothetical protein